MSLKTTRSRVAIVGLIKPVIADSSSELKTTLWGVAIVSLLLATRIDSYLYVENHSE